MMENKAFFGKKGKQLGETDYGRGKSNGSRVSVGIRVREKGKAAF